MKATYDTLSMSWGRARVECSLPLRTGMSESGSPATNRRSLDGNQAGSMIRQIDIREEVGIGFGYLR